MQNKKVLYFTLPLLALIAGVSYIGLNTPGFYKVETPNWQAQSYGQDMVDLFLICPVLLLSGLSAAKGNKAGLLIWGGTIIYLLYTFVIYCFDVHFNKLFIFYCLTLGGLFYAAVYFFAALLKKETVISADAATLQKITGIFFMIIAVLFYFLWLSEIVPAVWNGVVPKSLLEVGLPTNAVHVIDLSVFLPFLFITGLFALEGRPLGKLFSIVALWFCVLMDITIGWLAIYMKQKGITEGMGVAYIMGTLTMICLVLLILNLKKIN